MAFCKSPRITYSLETITDLRNWSRSSPFGCPEDQFENNLTYLLWKAWALSTRLKSGREELLHWAGTQEETRIVLGKHRVSWTNLNWGDNWILCNKISFSLLSPLGVAWKDKFGAGLGLAEKDWWYKALSFWETGQMMCLFLALPHQVLCVELQKECNKTCEGLGVEVLQHHLYVWVRSGKTPFSLKIGGSRSILTPTVQKQCGSQKPWKQKLEGWINVPCCSAATP